MERLGSRRNEIRSRRKTMRESVLEERRQTAHLSIESTPDKTEAVQTRGANRALAEKAEASRKLQELKARKAITARELLKAKPPPFNNYVRVKHTGLSPFKSYQEASKRSRVAPWRAPPPKPLPPPARTCGPGASKAGVPSGSKQVVQPHPVPTIKTAPGVIQFGAANHSNHKAEFRPPAKIQPLPFTSRTAVKLHPLKSDPIKGKQKKPPFSSGYQPTGKRASLKSRAATKSRTVKKEAAALEKPLVVTRGAKRGPETMKMPFVAKSVQPPPPIKSVKCVTRKPLTDGIRNPDNNRKVRKATQRPIEPSSRILRSSLLRSNDKENVLPKAAAGTSKLPKKVAKVKEAASKVSGPLDPPSVPSERTKGLEERSARLADEADRLGSLAKEWQERKAVLSLQTSLADEIDAVTGQTNLLISKKFVQYKGLIEGAYTNTRTTLEDLDGFWEMMYIQVEQLDKKYQHISGMIEKKSCIPPALPVSQSPNIFKHVQTREKKRSKPVKQPVGKSKFQQFLAEKLRQESQASAQVSPEKLGDNIIQDTKSVRAFDSPLLSMSVDEPDCSSYHSLNTTLRSFNTPRSTPRALENKRRASKSIRFSNTIMRLSSIFQDVQTS